MAYPIFFSPDHGGDVPWVQMGDTEIDHEPTLVVDSGSNLVQVYLTAPFPSATRKMFRIPASATRGSIKTMLDRPDSAAAIGRIMAQEQDGDTAVLEAAIELLTQRCADLPRAPSPGDRFTVPERRDRVLESGYTGRVEVLRNFPFSSFALVKKLEQRPSGDETETAYLPYASLGKDKAPAPIESPALAKFETGMLF